MIPRTIRLALPTDRRVEVRADLSLRVMLRTGLIKHAEDLILVDMLDGVLLDDREQARRLQDALVMHALDSSKPADLHGLADGDFAVILDYAVKALTGAVEDDDEAEAEDAAEEVLGVTDEPAPVVEESVEEALRRMDSTPSTQSRVPASTEVLARMEADDGS